MRRTQKPRSCPPNSPGDRAFRTTRSLNSPFLRLDRGRFSDREWSGRSSAVFLFAQSGVDGTIGVNYGTVANNLPPPAQVAHFLLESTIINRVRLFDANPEMLTAFAQTGIAITVTVPNEQIPHLAKLNFAQQWVKTIIVPHIPATNIVRILVGNEVLSTGQ
ncbi:hypothetical protein F0562_026755 [Nyssa sinensis]|uniref:Glucan endo-1,3-beta-D-glucosidase n=1 Tax=Nyssa sinensis TaxID=561372 RepID=A0A5J5BA92_9ASTE|nr:hypothetical protein F0562_026755 [Nyssa sinensis]